MITITVDDKQVKAMLTKLARNVGDLAPAMRAISEDMRDAVEENFASQGRPKWRDLAWRTKHERAKKGYWPGKILQRTGQLAASITKSSTKNSATVGTNKEYAAIHQFGGEISIAAHSRLYVQNRHKKGPFKGSFRIAQSPP